MITCEVLLPITKDWIVVSIVYASNQDGPRKDLWAEMVQFALSPTVIGRPLIVLDDFSQVLNTWDHSNGVDLSVGRRIRDFRDCLLDSELFDLVYKDCSFTWWNKSSTRPVAKKLDRILVNKK